MIGFLIQLAFAIWTPKPIQKSTQKASKFDQEGYSKHDASWLGFGSPLGTIFARFGAENWRQMAPILEPKLVQKSAQYVMQNDCKKSILKSPCSPQMAMQDHAATGGLGPSKESQIPESRGKKPHQDQGRRAPGRL